MCYQEDFTTTTTTTGKEEKRQEMVPHIQTPCQKCHIVIPYVQGLCESIKNICGKHGVDVHFKGGQTLKNILVSPKDKDSMASKNSVIYSYSCGRIDCDEEVYRRVRKDFG